MVTRKRATKKRATKKDNNIKDYLFSLGIIGWFTFGDDLKAHFREKGISEEELQGVEKQCKGLASVIKRVKEMI